MKYNLIVSYYLVFRLYSHDQAFKGAGILKRVIDSGNVEFVNSGVPSSDFTDEDIKMLSDAFKMPSQFKLNAIHCREFK